MDRGKPTAHEIADYILWSAHESGSFISNLKLQKLLYYIQAWHLAIFDEPLFEGKFQAWVHGPVLPSTYQRFRHYKWRNIDEEIQKPELERGVIDFVEEVLDEYGPLDAHMLERLAYQETPWILARGVLEADEPCETEISEAAMRDCYRARLSEDEIRSFREPAQPGS